MSLPQTRSSHRPQPQQPEGRSVCCDACSGGRGVRSLRVTNWLLTGILLALLAHLGIQMGIPSVIAETFKLDTCVTENPNDKPATYVHVVTHTFSGNSR